MDLYLGFIYKLRWGGRGGSPKYLNIKGLIDYHWYFNSNLVENNNVYKVLFVFLGVKIR